MSICNVIKVIIFFLCYFDHFLWIQLANFVKLNCFIKNLLLKAQMKNTVISYLWFVYLFHNSKDDNQVLDWNFSKNILIPLALVLMGKYVLIVYSLKGKETHTYAQEIYMYVRVLVHFSTYFVEASHKIVLLQWGRWLVWKKSWKRWA